MTNSKLLAGSIIGIVAATGVALVAGGALGPANVVARLWAAGAMALGLSVGLTTGLSAKEGSAQEFVKFVSAGVLVPVLGAIGALLAKKQVVTETSTYENAQLIQKTTTTDASFGIDLLHPFAILGVFFAGFALFAIVGIASGTLLRAGGFELKAV